MLKIFELELAKSRRRKRLFNKAFKIFKEKIEPYITQFEQNKVDPLLSFYYECLPKNIKTKKEKELLVEILRTLTEKIYLKSNYELIRELFFAYLEKVLGYFEPSLRISLWDYFQKNLKNEEKIIAGKILCFYELNRLYDRDLLKHQKEIEQFNKLDKLLVLTIILKLVYQTTTLGLKFVKGDIKDYLSLIPKITERKFKKDKKKWVLQFLKRIIDLNYDINLDFNENDLEGYIKEKYGKSLEELKKEYLFDEENDKPGKIFERVSWLLYKKTILSEKQLKPYKKHESYPNIFEYKGIELCNDYYSFVEKNDGYIYQLSNFIFEKRIVGFRILSLKELYKILKENKKEDEDLGLSKLKRNLFYKAILMVVSSSFMRLALFKDKRFLNKYPAQIKKMFYETNKEFVVAKKFYENTNQFLDKDEFYERKLFFIYENLRIVLSISGSNLLRMINYFWFKNIGYSILFLVNKVLEKETFNPQKSINLDYFLFGTRIKTKNGKIIKGYVQKDFNEWLNYLFKHKPKETHFSDEKELYYKKFRR
jgi:hypothetical protein